MYPLRLLALVAASAALVACLDGPTGPARGYVSVGEPCYRGTDCDTGAACEYGVCRLRCEEDGDCPGGASCVAAQDPGPLGYDWSIRVCLLRIELGCSDERDTCPDRLYCHIEEGLCREGCNSDLPCPGGFRCVDQICVPTEGK